MINITTHVKSRYLELPIGQNKIAIPYWCNRYRSGNPVATGPYDGKGSPQEIVDVSLQALSQENLNPNTISAPILLKTMKKYHIGLDCSGFAYQLLDFYYRNRGGKGIYYLLRGPDGRRGVRHLNADFLTKAPNSYPIPLRETDAGDLIRVNNGKHVIFILGKSKNSISYAHSSGKTKTTGVHLGQITITDWEKPLCFQKFSESTADNRSYHQLFSPENIPYLFRPHFLA